MSTVDKGIRAESVAAQHLQSLGFQIIDRNWKTKTCEIDIVAYRDRVMHFVEVKYRTSDRQGLGFDYITPAKLKRMRYAAHLWVSRHAWSGEYVMSGIAVTGSSQEIDFIEQLDANYF